MRDNMKKILILLISLVLAVSFFSCSSCNEPKEPLEISRVCHDPDVMQRVYDIGRKAAESADLSFD